MASKFYALLTTRGEAKLAQAVALGTQLKITQMAVGDGGGALPTPNASQTKLVNQKRIAAINTLSADPVNTNQIIAEQVIPEDEGGWWIREIGLFDDAGELIAVANCAETYKPLLAEGSGRTQVIRMIVIVSSTEAVSLKIDPSVVLATRKYIDDKVIEVKANTESVMKAHLDTADPHPQYATNASPTFTGSPKAPTPANGNNSTQIATTEFVQALFLALLSSEVNSASESLAATPKAVKTVSDKVVPVGVPVPWPLATPPAGWLKCNGALFSATTYPELAKAYPSLTLPDLRGEFIRGLDDGRGTADSGRTLLSQQSDAIRNITGTIAFSDDDSTNYTTALGSGVFARQAGTNQSFTGTTGSPAQVPAVLKFDASTVVPTAAENRPRNIAFNYIVRAA